MINCEDCEEGASETPLSGKVAWSLKERERQTLPVTTHLYKNASHPSICMYVLPAQAEHSLNRSPCSVSWITKPVLPQPQTFHIITDIHHLII